MNPTYSNIWHQTGWNKVHKDERSKVQPMLFFPIWLVLLADKPRARFLNFHQNPIVLFRLIKIMQWSVWDKGRHATAHSLGIRNKKWWREKRGFHKKYIWQLGYPVPARPTTVLCGWGQCQWFSIQYYWMQLSGCGSREGTVAVSLLAVYLGYLIDVRCPKHFVHIEPSLDLQGAHLCRTSLATLHETPTSRASFLVAKWKFGQKN